MLLRKPTHAGGSPTPSSTRLFSELDGFSSVPSPSISPPPVPVSPQSKTHAFFSSPFSTTPPSPLLPPRKVPVDERNGSASNVNRYPERLIVTISICNEIDQSSQSNTSKISYSRLFLYQSFSCCCSSKVIPRTQAKVS